MDISRLTGRSAAFWRTSTAMREGGIAEVIEGLLHIQGGAIRADRQNALPVNVAVVPQQIRVSCSFRGFTEANPKGAQRL
ncbi:MAG: hypothetical protein M0014_11355, partial [Actinomycetota bacterium]|nr:hypothetical protein [Actinomycetota bacterium]